MAADETDSTLAESGEFAVIDRLVRGRSQPASVTVGPGDDAAVVAAPDGRTVLCTDMLVQDRHFRLDWSSPHDVGRKAIAQNAADIEAMGARPTAYVVGFAAPADTRTADAVGLADGMWQEADSTGAGVVGGDMVRAPLWVISVAALGDLEGRRPVLRSGAEPGQRVAVCGELGRSAAGYALWDNGIKGFDGLRRRHLVPEPPYGQGRVAAQAGATSMIDVSDGLLADLAHIATASGVYIDLAGTALAGDVDAVADAARALGSDPWQWVLGGGEDHALVATFTAAPPPGWRVIGEVAQADGAPRVTVDGAEWGGAAGWQSY
ncbi:thiamine-phosphate kinase [Mycolicibacterium duvalii]|uniref:Thiamine-monophosphate kinase n=1 Tax=Mycolicibacterium duvalii TaxID=39688 RepID=A0A7I7K0A2_9MYCO|nr:thiamine-phosphate kinase [Mycolicibacterium duvalii]MCV7370119.1 thiamine-phosphate kinase [Mycolicibacterium duvalii]PEG38521.1 thiamine-phosphate kinase [Mycolicibacterium duvalii]BBX17517.1 thiamine-monophosphate kinase [Mycolicibacterium duvalii]